MTDHVIEVADGRTVGFADLGTPADDAVLWCHGGPGSRLEAEHLASDARDSGFRIVGIDRPGYGLSDPQPGRTIAEWVSDALAVADRLGIESFFTVGASTGGAFALAAAALAPRRVRGVVACCAMTDMRWRPARATMSQRHAHAVWDAPDRDTAIEAAIASHGLDGSKLMTGDGPPLAASDRALFTNPEWMRAMGTTMPQMFTHGLEGYADDRIADDAGWVGFDVGSISCPVIVLHGGSDVIVDVIHARHTASIVPNAQLRVFDTLGHFSIVVEVLPALVDLRAS
ncbi:MAG: alpha/beta fold hydrolase [Acidimicrobiia bacterium]